MALPDNVPSLLLPHSEPRAGSVVPAITAPLPRTALARLPKLHDETETAVRQTLFLARSAPAAGLLLAMGAVAALMGGAALAPAFAWSCLVLLGIGAILRSHLRGAGGPFAQDLAGSAADLRATLCYTGFAWGAGAFLALAPTQLPLVFAAFAALPSFGVALLLGDEAGILAFAAPVTSLTFAAAMTRASSLADALVLLALQGALAFLLFKTRSRGPAPAGRALR